MHVCCQKFHNNICCLLLWPKQQLVDSNALITQITYSQVTAHSLTAKVINSCMLYDSVLTAIWHSLMTSKKVLSIHIKLAKMQHRISNWLVQYFPWNFQTQNSALPSQTRAQQELSEAHQNLLLQLSQWATDWINCTLLWQQLESLVLSAQLRTLHRAVQLHYICIKLL